MNDRITLGAASYGTAVPESTAFNYLDVFFSNGGRRLDTAHVYASWLSDGAGASERCLGNWINSRDNRKDVCIITKGAHPDLETGEKRVTQCGIQSDLNDSLERLQTDYIDLYLLHRDDPEIAIADIAQWMHTHVQNGTIKQYGVSNWDTDRIQELHDYCSNNSLSVPTANQLGFGLARTIDGAGSHAGTRYMTADMFAWHQSHDIDVYGFSSQARGLFAKCTSYDDLIAHDKLNPYKTEKNKSVFSVLKDISIELDTTMLQVSLAALLHAPFPCFPVVSNSSMEQLVETLGAGEIALTDDQVTKLFAHWQ